MTDVAPIHDVAELTRDVETCYHARHRQQLPALAETAEIVVVVHSRNPDVPESLSDVLREMIGDLEVLMKKEERILFLSIRRGGGPGIENPIAVVGADPDDHDRAVAEIRRLTHELIQPEGPCRTWIAPDAGLCEFIDDLTEHIRLESDVVFPQFGPGARADA